MSFESSRAASMLLSRQDQSASSGGTSTGDQFLDIVAGGFNAQFTANVFVAALATALPLTVLMGLLFCFLRPYNTTVYAPRAKHADSKHAPPAIGKGPFSWIAPLMRTKEHDLVEKVGLDAALFMRFVRMLRNTFALLTILGCGILIPAALANQNSYARGSGFFLSLTPVSLKFASNVYWAHVIFAWLFTLVVCSFLWWNYRAVLRLRRQYFDSADYQKSLHARTLLVTDLPKQFRSDEGLARVVDEVRGSQAIPRTAIARNVKDLPDLVEEHESVVRQLESVLAKYMKNPDKLPAHRPTCKPSKKDRSRSSGQQVDAIDYLTGRIKDLEHEIKEVRLSVDNRNALGYGFASYQEIVDAHSVAYLARKSAPHGTGIALAPRPNNLIWRNLKMMKKERSWQNTVNNLWILLLTAIWTVPNVMIAVFLSNLANIGTLWPAFKQNLQDNQALWAVVQAVAAPAITTLFYFYLPAIFRKLRDSAGDVTKTSRERHVINKLYAFFIINNLIIFSLFSTIFGFFVTIGRSESNVKSASDVFSKLFNGLCGTSTYWVAYLLQRNLGSAIDLSQIVNLSWGSLMRRFGSPTPREKIESTAPQPFDYAAYYNYLMFYAAVAIAFGAIQPLVLPVVALYFFMDSFFKKYQLLYVSITKYESGGMFWRTLFNRTLVSVLVGQLIVALLVVAQTNVENFGANWAMLGALGPLPFILLGFKFYCSRAFDNQMYYYQTGRALLDAEMQGESAQTKRRGDRINVRFGHPVLYKPLITPMVSAKAQHMLKSVYNGRTSLDDRASVGNFSDIFMNPMESGKPGKATKTGPFEFVDENNMDFEHFKNRPEFRDEAGGEGQLFGRAPDQVRPGTPSSMGALSRAGTMESWEAHSRDNSDPSYYKPSQPHSRQESRGSPGSRDSSRTRVAGDVGVEYPRGYHQTPSNLRDQSPSGMDGFRGHRHNLSQTRTQEGLIGQAAPMPMGTPYAPAPGGYSMAGTPGYETPGEDTSYDYFRHGRRYN